MYASLSPIVIALSALVLGGCNLAFPLDGYGSGAGTGGSSASGNGGGAASSSTAASSSSSSGTSSSSGAATPHLYVFGGGPDELEAGTDKVFAAKVAPNGSVGTFEVQGSMAFPFAFYAGAATADHVYLLGGYDAAGMITSKAEMGTLGANGVYTWSTLPSLTLAAERGRAAVTHGGLLFELGGDKQGNAEDTAILVANLGADGTFPSWFTSMTPSPGQRRSPAVVVDSAGHLYFMGGQDAGSGVTSTVWMATLSMAGGVGAWTPQPSFNSARQAHCAVLQGTRIYIMGGYHNSGFSDIQRADLDGSGKITAWTTLPQKLPIPLRSLGCTVFGNRLYIAGGVSNAAVADVHSAAFQANGDLDAWTTEPSLPAATAGAFIVVR